MVRNENIPCGVTNWNHGTTEQDGIFIYFGLGGSIDRCLTKYGNDVQKRRVMMMLPNGSRQQFFMHVEMGLDASFSAT